MAHMLRVLAAAPQDLSSVPSTHIRQLTNAWKSILLLWFDAFFWPLWAFTYPSPPMHINNINKSFKK